MGGPGRAKAHAGHPMFLAALLASVAAGCLGEPLPTAGDAARHVDVGTRADENAFSPAVVRVAAGEIVTLVVHNNGTRPHALTNHDFHLHLGTLQPGESASIPLRPTAGGAFALVCEEPGHEGVPMRGTLEVV